MPGIVIPRDAADVVPSVLPDRIDGNPDRVEASPEAFGSQVGQAVAGVGQGLDQASAAAMQVRQVQNVALVNDATTRLQNAANTIAFGDGTTTNPGFFGKQGSDALSAYPDAQTALNKAQSDIQASLPPDAQRDFSSYARRYVGSRLDSFGQHFEQQRAVYTDQLASAAVDADTSSAVGFYNDPTKMQSAVADGRYRIEQQANLTGEAPEVTQDKLSRFTSGVYAGVADRIAEQDPVAAWKYYQDNQTLISGPVQSALESKLKPELYALSSRNDADTIMNGGFGAVSQGVVSEADRQGVDPTLALTTAKIESGMGARLQSPTSSASGVFGMMPATFAEQGGTNPNDTGQQITTGVKNLAASSATANDAVGGNAAPWQIYLVHQQGAAGGPALLKADPGESAVAALTQAYGGNATLATRAITGNGGSADMTVGQFRNLIQGTYEQASSTVSVPSPGAAPGVPTSNDPRDHLATWLSQANGVVSPLGTSDPIYSDMVSSRIRAKTAEIQAGQEQADRSAQNTLLSASLGLTAASNPPPTPTAPMATMPATAGTAGPNAHPLAAAVANISGNTPSPRPTSIDALLATSPAVRQAWASATAETQRGILSIVERNATEGPPSTPEAQTKFYGLLSESTRDPGTFLKENLADPELLATMPRDYVHQLMDRQASMDGKAVTAQEQQASMTHARAVVMPDLLAAGINPRGTTPSSAQAYAAFDGRLDEALQQFQQQNQRRPNDTEIKNIGQTLLTPGFQRGSGSLWGMLPNDASERLYQAQTAGTVGKFYPTIPAPDRAQITSAYGAIHNGAKPTEAEVQTYYMAGRTRASSARPQGPAPMLSTPRPAAQPALQTAAASPLPMAPADDDHATKGY